MTSTSKTHIEITMTCRPFTAEGRGPYRLAIEREDGTVTVWDSVAQHYTRLHILSLRSMAAARRKADWTDPTTPAVCEHCGKTGWRNSASEYPTIVQGCGCRD